PVFSMSKLVGVDTFLGPEMKSTGEVMGIDRTFEGALTKALMSSDLALEPGAAVLLSLSDHTKAEALPLIRKLAGAGCPLYATEGTAQVIEALGLPVTMITKMRGGHPNVVDVIQDGTVQCVINTPEGLFIRALRDGFLFRRTAAEKRIPCFTSMDTARAAVDALANRAGYDVATLREYVNP
ncbi:MAG: carbamoyl-phosphate synthase large subunit, partial [Tepidiformaceae bacterium]